MGLQIDPEDQWTVADEALAASIARDMRDEIDREVRASGLYVPFAFGTYVMFLETSRVVIIVDNREFEERHDPIPPCYVVRDILTDVTFFVHAYELGEPLCEVEVLAWAAK